MGKLLDITGLRFGRLTALSYRRMGKRTYWDCVCDCGNRHAAETNLLRRGNIKSCGCWNKERSSIENRTHGETKTRLYRIWRAMIDRCERKKSAAYKNYGGRGIKVCERWREDFLAFKEDMGVPAKGLSIDRINNDGNYEPSNCRWADYKTQSLNKRSNVLYELNGRKMPMKMWAEEIGIPEITIRKRLQSGVPFAIAVSPKNLRYGSYLRSARQKLPV